MSKAKNQKLEAQERKRAAERERTRELYRLLYEAGSDAVVIGIDEVGRGAVAGPLTVAAVALPLEPMIEGLNDSKKLTARRREELAAHIYETALCARIVHIAPQHVDAIGMAAAMRAAILEVLAATKLEPDLLLLDGNPLRIHPAEHAIVKGDATVACIAAASIVAKVARDALMDEYGETFVSYGFSQNKGYASAAHIDAIKTYGLSEIHRATFCRNFLQTSLF